MKVLSKIPPLPVSLGVMHEVMAKPIAPIPAYAAISHSSGGAIQSGTSRFSYATGLMQIGAGPKYVSTQQCAALIQFLEIQLVASTDANPLAGPSRQLDGLPPLKNGPEGRAGNPARVDFDPSEHMAHR